MIHYLPILRIVLCDAGSVLHIHTLQWLMKLNGNCGAAEHRKTNAATQSPFPMWKCY